MIVVKSSDSKYIGTSECKSNDVSINGKLED